MKPLYKTPETWDTMLFVGTFKGYDVYYDTPDEVYFVNKIPPGVDEPIRSWFDPTIPEWSMISRLPHRAMTHIQPLLLAHYAMMS